MDWKYQISSLLWRGGGQLFCPRFRTVFTFWASVWHENSFFSVWLCCHLPIPLPGRSLFSGSTLVYHPLGTARARNPGVSTEVLGNVSRRKKGEESSVPNYYAICTLDGTLTLIDNDKILWSVYVDHQLFALCKLDITVSIFQHRSSTDLCKHKFLSFRCWESCVVIVSVSQQ